MTDLLKKLETYKQTLTFPDDKAKVEEWEKAVSKAIVKTEAMKLAGIKELVALMKLKIKGCDGELLNNRNLTDDGRKRIFDRRDIWQWVISFFENAERKVAGTEETLEKIVK